MGIFAASGYLVKFGPVHMTTAEVLCLIIGLLFGLLIGVHMAVPHYARRGD